MNPRRFRSSDPRVMVSISRWVSAVLVSAAVVFGAASGVSADALVIVEVRASEDAVEGTVTLRSRADRDRTFRCDVEAGRCRIDRVPGGQYDVSFRSSDGTESNPRSAMIPPSGTVTLVVPAG